jgi:hypothetical protein
LASFYNRLAKSPDLRIATENQADDLPALELMKLDWPDLC